MYYLAKKEDSEQIRLSNKNDAYRMMQTTKCAATAQGQNQTKQKHSNDRIRHVEKSVGNERGQNGHQR